jgi:hypothetical protein
MHERESSRDKELPCYEIATKSRTLLKKRARATKSTEVTPPSRSDPVKTMKYMGFFGFIGG